MNKLFQATSKDGVLQLRIEPPPRAAVRRLEACRTIFRDRPLNVAVDIHQKSDSMLGNATAHGKAPLNIHWAMPLESTFIPEVLICPGCNPLPYDWLLHLGSQGYGLLILRIGGPTPRTPHRYMHKEGIISQHIPQEQ